MNHGDINSESIVVINPFIHQKLKKKVSRDEFVRLVNPINYIRTRKNTLSLSFYITSIEEYDFLRKFHDAIKHGKFNFERDYVFALTMTPKLFQWFSENSLAVIQKQILAWTASTLYFNADKSQALKNQIYRPMLEECEKFIKRYYSNLNEMKDYQWKDDVSEEQENGRTKKENEIIQIYNNATKDYCNELPPEVLSSPLELGFSDSTWSLNFNLSFEFYESYLTEFDWKNIIVDSNRDELQRSESRKDIWEKWLHMFVSYNRNKEHVYSFFPRSKPHKKYNREKIENDVIKYVWNRDNARCRECGSKEKLEFDHIIPVSKGGSNTSRNIQLLCESCNRKKYNKLTVN